MYQRRQKILFKHCDPAGIVFYPRYFEMINDTVEDFFAAVLDYPFHQMMPQNGVPTVAIQTQFRTPSRHGDILDITLQVEQVGRTSLTFCQTATHDGQDRFTSTATVVHVDQDGRPTPWPDAVARTLKNSLEGAPS